MVGQALAALGQEHGQPVGAVDDRHEHGGRGRAALAAGHPEAVAHPGGVERRRAAELRLDPRALGVARQAEQRDRHPAKDTARRLSIIAPWRHAA
jgi:hypothetical protein